MGHPSAEGVRLLLARNPSLYSVLNESKVDDGLMLPVVAIDLFDLQVGQHEGRG